MYYVYVIQNEFGELYIGRSSNLRARLAAHNAGMNTSTKGHKWDLVYYEAYKASADAIRRECSLKTHGQSKRWLKERIKSSCST